MFEHLLYIYSTVFAVSPPLIFVSHCWKLYCSKSAVSHYSWEGGNKPPPPPSLFLTIKSIKCIALVVREKEIPWPITGRY